MVNNHIKNPTKFNIYENDDDNLCPFYHKIGACRHGERCTKTHNKPIISKCLLFPHMFFYSSYKSELDKKRHYEFFYDQVYKVLIQYGHIEYLYILNNLGDHLFGNVYVLYEHYDSAYYAYESLKNRYFAGKILKIEYTPLLSFDDSICKKYQHQYQRCKHGDYCNFMHIKKLTNHIKRTTLRENKKIKYKIYQSLDYISDFKKKQKKKENLKKTVKKDDDDNDLLNNISYMFINKSNIDRKKVIQKWNISKMLKKEINID